MTLAGTSGAAGNVPELMSVNLPVSAFESAKVPDAPVANSVFAPPVDAQRAPAFTGVLKIHATQLRTLPVLNAPVIQGRDVRKFPGDRARILHARGCARSSAAR